MQAFSAYITHVDDDAYSIIRDDAQALDLYVQRMHGRSYVASDLTYGEQSRYVILSTCTNATGDLRSVVHAVLIPADSTGGEIY